MEKDREIFLNYMKEIILYVLRETQKRIDEFDKIGDLSGSEILSDKVIKPYEKIYKALLSSKIDELKDDEFEYLKNMLEDIKEKNCIDEKKIEQLMKRRVELKGKSGAEVVEKFYKYSLNRALEKKDKIVEKYNDLCKEEQNLDYLLKETIQEQEQFDIIYKLQPVREKIRAIEDKYIVIEDEIKKIKNRLENRWSFEIYGVIPESELLEVYKSVFDIKE